MKARMLVAAHKPAPVPTDAFYLPVHVGHALNPEDFGFQPDDEGENISSLNQSYCELTALFWAWKNLDCDVIGLSHYRRYFGGSQPGPQDSAILSNAEALTLMGQHDIVLSKPRNYMIETVDSHYRNGHHGEDLDVLRRVLTKRSPNFVDSFDHVFGGRKLSLYNMFLMRRDEFDDYSAWLFGALEAVAAEIGDDSERTRYQQRTIGYLGERLLNVWAHGRAQDLRIGYRKVVNTEGEPKFKKGVQLLQRKFLPQSASPR